MNEKKASLQVEDIVKVTNELVPLYPDIIVQKIDSSFILKQLAPWVIPFLGRSAEDLVNKPLSETSGELGAALLYVSEEITTKRERITDYTVEFSSPTGAAHAVIIFGDLFSYEENESSVSIMFRLHDISSSLKKNRQLSLVSDFEGMIGSGERMHQLFRKISIYGPTEASVVITGETGTGKELVAQAIHNVSKRKKQSFVSVNCSAISEELFESELFGHSKGSFTGASSSHKGRFERASGGTLFLDEMGDMPLRAQTKLLRVLETSEIEPVGSEQPIQVNVRVLAATNVELERAVAGKEFRADLFHRLAVFRIHIPPLRHRTEDIPLLCEHFLSIFRKKYNKPPLKFSEDAIVVLMEYRWPGNIRELRNVVERMVVEACGPYITKAALSEWVIERIALTTPVDTRNNRSETGKNTGESDSNMHYLALPQNTNTETGNFEDSNSNTCDDASKGTELTAAMIYDAFSTNNGNLTAAARSLGLHKSTLYRQMKRLSITRENLEESGDLSNE